MLLAGKPEGRRQLGRPRYIWKDNIKTDLQAMEWGDMDWTYMTQYMDSWPATVNVVMNLRA
jgi:hypothetical protein